MTKLNSNIKKALIKETLEYNVDLSYLARKHGIHRSNLEYLRKLYLRYGDSVFEKRHRIYSDDEKIEAVKRVIENGERLMDVSIDICLRSPSCLKQWIKDFRLNGKIINMKKKKYPKYEEAKAMSNEELIKRNLELEAENAYLKKLIALREKK